MKSGLVELGVRRSLLAFFLRVMVTQAGTSKPANGSKRGGDD